MYKLLLITLIVIGSAGCFKQEKITKAKYEKKKKHFLEYAVPKESYTPGVYDGNPEPPYPDLEEDVKILEGIDADKDGLRDDLEIWINRNGKDKNIRSLLRAKAIFLRKMMSNKKTKENGAKIFVELTRLSGCESLVESEDSENLSYYLSSYITNTNERKSHIESMHNMALPRHSEIPSPQEIVLMATCFCGFEIEKKSELADKYLIKNNLINLPEFKRDYFLKKIEERGKRGVYENDFGIRDYSSCLSAE